MDSYCDKNSFVFQKTLTSRYKPCVVEQLDDKRFVVGTYELVEPDTELAKKYIDKDLKRINRRAGSLEIIDELMNLTEVYECYHGGVFALKALHDRLIVAHANGVLAIYTCDPIHLLLSFETNSMMLTSIDWFFFGNHYIYYTGGSCGTLSCIQEHSKSILDKIQELPVLKEPIWMVNTKLPFLDGRPLVLIGSEDAKWRIFDHCTKKVLFTNSDAESGVTSFEVLESNGTTILFVGSYDGCIRAYLANYSPYLAGDTNTFPRFQLIYKIDIGGGIWRIYSKMIDTNQVELFGSAMHFGAFIMKIPNFFYTSLTCQNLDNLHEKITLPKPISASDNPIDDEKDIANNNADTDDSQEDLIYGSAKNQVLSVICSYNERLLHCFSIVH